MIYLDVLSRSPLFHSSIWSYPKFVYYLHWYASFNITFENTYQSVLHVQMVLYRSVCIKFYKCLFGKKTTIKWERKKCIEDDMVNKIRKLLIVDIFVDVSDLFSNRQSNRYRYKIHIITWLFVIAFVWNRRLVKDDNKHCISNFWTLDSVELFSSNNRWQSLRLCMFCWSLMNNCRLPRMLHGTIRLLYGNINIMLVRNYKPHGTQIKQLIKTKQNRCDLFSSLYIFSFVLMNLSSVFFAEMYFIIYAIKRFDVCNHFSNNYK